MTPEQAATYLQRLGVPERPPPTAGGLARLHMRHVVSVPFENLDIAYGNPITLEPDALFDKIVTRRRGGFCYELNGLFAALLNALGYSAELRAARVWTGKGYSVPPDHAAILVSDESGQHSPESHVTQSTICSLGTEHGRYSVSGTRLITTVGDEITETHLDDDAAVLACYRDVFGMSLDRVPPALPR